MNLVAEVLHFAGRVASLAPHLPHALLRLDHMIDAYVERTAMHVRSPQALFLAAMREKLSADRYAEIQEDHFSPPMLDFLHGLGGGSVEQKYLDFPLWAVSKFNTARRLGMHTGQFTRVLDIGSGPGHFGLVAKYMGLDYVGIDAPMVKRPVAKAHIYDDLFNLFELERVSARITAHEAFDVPGRFDLLVCLMGTFPVHNVGYTRTPWSWNDWQWFLGHLVTNVMSEKFTMFFQIAPNYFAPVVDDLRPICREMNFERGTFTIDDTFDRAAIAGVLSR